MTKGESWVAECVLSALYLRGLGTLSGPGFCGVEGSVLGAFDGSCGSSGFSTGYGRRWPMVEAALRRSPGGLGQAEPTLRRAGLWEEATLLAEPGRLDAGLSALEAGLVLTVMSEGYPAKWRAVFGSKAPPALWCYGERSKLSRFGLRGSDGGDNGLVVGVVGSREISGVETARAKAVGAAVRGLRGTVVSGGARGVDATAVAGALSRGEVSGRCVGVTDDSDRLVSSVGSPGSNVGAVEVWPCGLAMTFGGRKGGLGRQGGDLYGEGLVRLSVCPPHAGFTSGQAKERNALVYSLGIATVVLSPRFRTGGTWAGACDALRRRLGPVLVGLDGSAASRALVALGGVGMMVSADVGEQTDILRAALAGLPRFSVDRGQPTLFGVGKVRERPAPFVFS